MQQDLHDVNSLSVGKHLLSPLVCELLSLASKGWSVFLHLRGGLVSEVEERLLLGEPVEPEQPEVALDGDVLALSDVDAALFVVDASVLPHVVLLCILGFESLIALSVDHEQDILQVFSQDLLVLVSLEQGVEVVDLVLLVIGQLLLQEPHRVHHNGNMVEVEHLLAGIAWLEVSSASLLVLLNLRELASELLLEIADGGLDTLFIFERLVRHDDLFVLLLLPLRFLLSKELLMHLVESLLGWLASVVLGIWVELLPARSQSLRSLEVLLDGLLLLVVKESLVSQLFLSLEVESVMGVLVLPIIHHVDDLVGKVINLWFMCYLLHLIIKLGLLTTDGFHVLILQESLLVIEELVKISISLISLGETTIWFKRALF